MAMSLDRRMSGFSTFTGGGCSSNATLLIFADSIVGDGLCASCNSYCDRIILRRLEGRRRGGNVVVGNDLVCGITLLLGRHNDISTASNENGVLLVDYTCNNDLMLFYNSSAFSTNNNKSNAY